MTDPFNSSKRRISRAKVHIHDLNGRINKFLVDYPCSHAVETDTNGIDQLHKIKFSTTIPDSFGEIAADALENLRAALDQAGYAVAVAAGVGDPRKAYFPIGDDAMNLESIITMNCKNIPSEIVAIFRGFQPYQGGNDLIWALNKANNINKHRLLVPACQFLSNMNLKIRGSGGDCRIPPPIWDRRKNEVVFAVTSNDAKIEYNVNGAYCVSFDEIEVIRGYPAAHILGAMACEVECIVMATETEVRRIGLVQ
ncbi:conserved protein of unknown function [Candidatus Nitrotoga arctica]|uniref:Uncharacterized protein n=1 Tax=Candidatus Nitrotoga arctica TaxID=453162 RepID=A0ABN8ALS0_9PROT|nr:conserved protein of unknown function [Candidatus Nitrotoga arctica]